MKFTIKADLFKKVIKAAAKAMSGGTSTLPILRNVLLQARKSELLVTGTDINTRLQIRIPPDDVSISKPGELCAPAGDLIKILEKEKEKVTIEAAGDPGLQIVSEDESATYKLWSSDANEFPERHGGDKKPAEMTGESAAVMRALGCAVRACSTDETRQVLMGVQISCQGTQIKIAATDGRRLILFFLDIECPKMEAVMSAKFVELAVQALSDWGHENFDLSIGKNMAVLTSGNLRLEGLLISGKWPSVEAVVPPESKSTIKISREGMIAAVAKSQTVAALVPREVGRCIKITTDKTGTLKIVSNLAVGRAESTVCMETIELTGIGKDGARFATNPGYLLDLLYAAKEDVATIEYNGDDSPICVRESGMIAVIMPMRFE